MEAERGRGEWNEFLRRRVGGLLLRDVTKLGGSKLSVLEVVLAED